MNIRRILSAFCPHILSTHSVHISDSVQDPNAHRACHAEGLLDDLQGMDSKLEAIQKELNQYLEAKRQVFPRFYFLSNEDLLEILGQQKDPEQVQKHIKKMFVGIRLLTLVQPHERGTNKTIEAVGIISNDGEQLPIPDEAVVKVDGAVEAWLVQVELSMFSAVQKSLSLTRGGYKTKNKERWVKQWPGQLLINVGQLFWTADCTRALESIAKGQSKAMKQLKKKQVAYLAKLSDYVRGNLSKVDRKKIVALITMELHSRDVQEKMIKANCNDPNDFEWLSQLRFYFDQDAGDYGMMNVKQTNTDQEYGYEYQGNNGRLVITPLTDRCVLTLTTALYLQRGGSPLGPAGTGKTETVKDLGKNLAKYVVVFNCSDGPSTTNPPPCPILPWPQYYPVRASDNWRAQEIVSTSRCA